MPRRRLLQVIAPVAFALLLTIPVSATGQSSQVKEPTAVGTGGAAATVDVLATDAAIDVLRDGGNAVDATVAAAAVLGVTEPFSCGIGGGGFMLIRTSGGTVTTIDHREQAPAAMRPDSFGAPAPLPFNAARYSGLSAGVPGTVAGWDEALSHYGTMSLAEALQPAIDVARKGSSSTRRSSTRRWGTSTSSTTSLRRAPCTSIRTARRATSARCSGIRISPARTSGSGTSAPKASTAAPSPMRWSRPSSTHPSPRRQTTSGAPA